MNFPVGSICSSNRQEFSRKVSHVLRANTNFPGDPCLEHIGIFQEGTPTDISLLGLGGCFRIIKVANLYQSSQIASNFSNCCLSRNELNKLFPLQKYRITCTMMKTVKTRNLQTDIKRIYYSMHVITSNASRFSMVIRDGNYIFL